MKVASRKAAIQILESMTININLIIHALYVHYAHNYTYKSNVNT